MLGMGDKKKTARNGHHAVDTLIGPGVVIRGDLQFRGGCYIEGEVHGRVLAEEGGKAVLTIAEQGHIEGEVRAPVVIINGRLTGDVHASERVELAAHARVHGNIHYSTVEMAAGAMITGRLIHADTPLALLTDASTSVPARQLAAPDVTPE